MRAPATIPELQVQAAEALRAGDIDALTMLREVNSEWLQTDEERESLDAMLAAMQGAIDDPRPAAGDGLEEASIALGNLIHTLTALTTSMADRDELIGALCCAVSVAERIQEGLAR